MSTALHGSSSLLRILTVTPLLVPLAGCATTGSTLGSGVGDTLLDHPPFYAGVDVERLDPDTPLGIFPVAYQAGASQDAFFDPRHGDELQALLDEMNGYLASASTAAMLESHGSGVADPKRIPPDVRFGCPTGTGDPQDECVEREDGALGRGDQPLELSVGRPSPAWIAWTDTLMQQAGVEHAVVLTLEVGQYWIRQRGWRGTKVVELGTGHEAGLPWLTALDGPVTVLQLTGALVEADGSAVRIGAEGLLVRRTGMLVSALGAQELIGDEEVRALRTARRDDLPGQPLVWQTALRTLVEQLTGRPLPTVHARKD